MLEELLVLNGEMSVKFDTMNTKYTVLLEPNETKLNLQYKLKEDTNIVIEGNYDLENGSIVKLIVSDKKKSTDYYINVYIKDTQEVNKTFNDFVNLEIDTEKTIPEYIAPGIACTCFLLILFLFVYLFHKRETK